MGVKSVELLPLFLRENARVCTKKEIKKYRLRIAALEEKPLSVLQQIRFSSKGMNATFSLLSPCQGQGFSLEKKRAKNRNKKRTCTWHAFRGEKKVRSIISEARRMLVVKFGKAKDWSIDSCQLKKHKIFVWHLGMSPSRNLILQHST